MGKILDEINAGLNLRFRIREEHSDKEETGFCSADGQPFPCITIQSLDEGPPVMKSEAAPKKKKNKNAPRGK